MALCVQTFAQPYSVKPVRYVMPYPPDGSMDIIARWAKQVKAAMEVSKNNYTIRAESFDWLRANGFGLL